MNTFTINISIARRLSKEKVNNLLVGSGAEKYAHKEGFERKNMLTKRAKIHYYNRIDEIKEQQIKPYSGHDTVGAIDIGLAKSFIAATAPISNVSPSIKAASNSTSISSFGNPPYPTDL